MFDGVEERAGIHVIYIPLHRSSQIPERMFPLDNVCYGLHHRRLSGKSSGNSMNDGIQSSHIVFLVQAFNCFKITEDAVSAVKIVSQRDIDKTHTQLIEKLHFAGISGRK